MKKIYFLLFLFFICISMLWSQSSQARTHYDNGSRQYNQGNYDAAIREFTEAIRLDPNYAQAYNFRAWVNAYSLRKDYNNALADVNYALKLLPNDIDCLDTRGWVYLRMGNYNKAIADFEAVLKIDSSHHYSNQGIAEARKLQQASAVAQQPKTNTQQPQTNNNQPRANTQSNTQQNKQNVQRLTYYVNGRSKTTNAVFVGFDQARFYLGNDGNIYRSVRASKPDGSWHNWENQGVVMRTQNINVMNAWGVYGVLVARVNFNNATEERRDRTLLIYIYRKLDNNDFMKIDGDYVYTLQEVWREVR